jgi:hypothetical protein
MKLTRKQIKEGLEATPIDTLLMGSPKTLTAKQKEFAKGVAMGKPKAQAYREAYDTSTTANAQAVEAHRLSNNPHISLMIESMKVSLEAQKYLLPAHLRALTIQKLTEKALDPDVNHAQQIKALELLGKITEVALFSERKEIITTDTSATAKDRLIQSLAQAIRSSANISMDKKAEADQLLAEITGGSLSNPEPDTIDQASEDNITQDDKAEGYLPNEPEAEETGNGSTPPSPTPQIAEIFGDPTTHTIPLKQSAPVSETPPLSVPNTEGEGVSNFWEEIEKAHTETPPLIDSGSPTPPIDISNPNWREA